MRPLRRILLFVALGLALITAGLAGWVLLTWERVYDDVPYPKLAGASDDSAVERGRYLVQGPAHCTICHVANVAESMRADAGEVLPLAGGYALELGPLGVLYSANLTPDPDTGIGRYSDEALFRLLRHNIKPNGRASVAPLMPFQNMADADLVAIVAYLRSTPPVRREVPGPEWSFVGKAVQTLLRPAAIGPVLGQMPPAVAPAQKPTVERGAYLANSVANCMACHSPIDRVTGELVGPAFSGFNEGEVSSLDPSVLLRAPNLTPDPTGVLTRFEDEDQWVGRFRAGRVVAASIMAWGPFSRMEDADLRAIYRYLNSLTPVANDVGLTVDRVAR